MSESTLLQTLEGTLERLTFQNDENGYTVARLVPKGKTYEVTVVGTLSGVNVGELLHLEGVWSSHPQYGRQFEVRSYSVHYPATVEGLADVFGATVESLEVANSAALGAAMRAAHACGGYHWDDLSTAFCRCDAGRALRPQPVNAAVYRDLLGLEYLTLFPHLIGDPYKKADEQMARFAEEVLPLL